MFLNKVKKGRLAVQPTARLTESRESFQRVFGEPGTQAISEQRTSQEGSLVLALYSLLPEWKQQIQPGQATTS